MIQELVAVNALPANEPVEAWVQLVENMTQALCGGLIQLLEAGRRAEIGTRARGGPFVNKSGNAEVGSPPI